MKRQLSQLQRLLVAGIYIVIIVMIYGLLNGGIADLLNQSEPTSVWFFSGILLIIMGMYVTEPYFSSPTDTLSNSISLILVLTSLTNILHIVSSTGTDELQILRIVLSNVLSLIIVMGIDSKKKKSVAISCPAKCEG